MNPEDQLVSIIIPCHNAELWISECLNSVIAQTYRPIEIIVVDDGSTDSSAEIVSQCFPNVLLIRTENRGVSAARNAGFGNSTGRYIQFLDADDILLPKKVELQVTALDFSQGDVAYGDWERLCLDQSGNVTKSQTVNRQIQDDAEIELFTDFWCPPAVYLFSREIVERVGGMRENLTIIQDARFALDCALHGARFVYCPVTMAQYRDHAVGSLSKRDPLRFLRDIFDSACDVENWWYQNGGLTTSRHQAITRVYAYVAHETFRIDRETFDKVYKRLIQVSPGYVPKGPRLFRLASQMLGYRNAECIAYLLRRLQASLHLYQLHR